jgi:acetyl-CoA C-acetyltransferase
MYLTKHSMGIYSTEAPTRAWRDAESTSLQQQIDAAPRLSVASDPTGKATVETYTVSFGRSGPKRGIVIARNDAGERVIANTLADEAILQQLIAHDPIGHAGNVRVQDGVNILEL